MTSPPIPPRHTRRAVLAGVSSLIGGLALALTGTSDRQRLLASFTKAGSDPLVNGPVAIADSPVKIDLSVTEASLPPVLDPELSVPAQGHTYDLVINHGRVVDPESGFDGKVHLGIDKHRITNISVQPLAGKRVIDARGMVVGPGFIDLLSYEPNEFGSRLKLVDGVTTNLAMHGVGSDAKSFFEKYQGRSRLHFGGAFHHHFHRSNLLGVGVNASLSGAQLEKMLEFCERNLQDGLAGIAFSPEYSPGTSTEEMIELSHLAARSGHVCFHHLRYSDPDPPGTSLEALAETLGICRITGAPVHILHITSTGGTFVMSQAIAAIEAARADGNDVTACVYPYDFWGTFLASERFAPGWQKRFRLSLDRLQVAGTTVRLSEQSWDQAVADNVLVAALGSIPEQDLRAALIMPWVLVASDAIATESLNNHPRGAGSFSRLIGRYVRELGTLDLRSALAKMTVLPALRVQSMLPEMARKGRIQRGADADVTIFDPETILDNATVAEPGLASSGVRWVLVHGQIAVSEGQVVEEVRAGQPLKSQY